MSPGGGKNLEVTLNCYLRGEIHPSNVKDQVLVHVSRKPYYDL